MENKRIIIFVGITIIGLALSKALFSFAYDENTTHPVLTQATVEIYNNSYPDSRISAAEQESLVQGSINEDNPWSRSLRHFYDPVNNKGLGTFASAKDWANDTVTQASSQLATIASRTLYGKTRDIFSGETDYSWERGIYEYTWGNKERGLEALGHTLHLLQDLSVPDHTRNDSHAEIGTIIKEKYLSITPEMAMNFLNKDVSPYELFVRIYKPDPTGSISEKPIIVSSLNDYFDKLASYSNKNFFSGDTILSTKYTGPKILKESSLELKNGETNTFGYNVSDGTTHKIVRIERQLGKGKTEYSIEDPDDLILSDYWSLLSKQAVMHGAGVIKLFFDEVAKEKETRILYNKNKSWLTKKWEDFTVNSFGFVKSFYGSSVTLEDVDADPRVPHLQNTEQAPSIILSQVEPKPTEVPAEKPVTKPLETTIPNAPKTILTSQSSSLKESPPDTTEPAPVKASSNTSANLPIMGVGGGGGTGGGSGGNSGGNQTDTTAPNPPIISSPVENYIASSTSISFSGTAEANAIISNGFSALTSLADNVGSWILSLAGFLQGTSTIQFFAADAAGNKSSGTSRTIFIDSTAPSVSWEITECGQSLSANGCLVANANINISWSSASTDLKNYTIECETNGGACVGFPSISDTTSTSTAYTIPTENQIFTFKIKARDNYGNISSEQTKTAKWLSRPLVINEIAWAGTSAGRWADEWIEIFNPSSETINLASTTLISETDSGPNIVLSGSLSPGAYYLIERTDDNTISNITASSTSPFGNGLNNAGEVLALKFGNTVLDKTPALAGCGGGWCGGSTADNYLTMERYDPLSSGEDSSNWSSFAGILNNGKNADNQDIYGTPGKRNSINYFISKNGTSLAQNKTLKKSNSPYVITSVDYVINNGITLTIEPGVVIKFYNSASALTANGIINAQGTTADQIVFTSFKDDTYAGDTNQDAAATSPAAGDWGAIKLLANGSVLDNAIVRYGGVDDGFTNQWANIRANNVSFTLQNSTIQYSKKYGLWLQNTSGTISSNTVSNSVSYGITASGGTLTFSNNTISNNGSVGLLLASGVDNSFTLSNNIFNQNAEEAARAISVYPSLSGNTASGNLYNGINIQGNLTQDHTFSVNENFPYIITGTYTVQSGKNLTVPAGTIIKFTNAGELDVSGKIFVSGTAGSKVVFTSVKDDAYGGDTNNDGLASSPQAGNWKDIYLTTGAASSTISNAIIRYGGSPVLLLDPEGALRIFDVSVDIADSIIENNYNSGIVMSNSTSSSITGSLIQNHSDPGFIGLSLKSASNPFIQNTTFKNNATGINAVGSSTVQNGGGIIFDGNTTDDNPPGLIP